MPSLPEVLRSNMDTERDAHHLEIEVDAAWSGCGKLKLSDNFDALVAVTIVLLACFDPSI